MHHAHTLHDLVHRVSYLPYTMPRILPYRLINRITYLRERAREGDTARTCWLLRCGLRVQAATQLPAAVRALL